MWSGHKVETFCKNLERRRICSLKFAIFRAFISVLKQVAFDEGFLKIDGGIISSIAGIASEDESSCILAKRNDPIVSLP